MASVGADRIRGFGSRVVHFTFVVNEESVPRLYVCETRGCHSLVYFVGMHVVTEGHVTCMRCLRPMPQADCTVH